jgi:hypothetical protein
MQATSTQLFSVNVVPPFSFTLPAWQSPSVVTSRSQGAQLWMILRRTVQFGFVEKPLCGTELRGVRHYIPLCHYLKMTVPSSATPRLYVTFSVETSVTHSSSNGPIFTVLNFSLVASRSPQPSTGNSPFYVNYAIVLSL